jgi:hypothetical protein
VSNNRKKAAAPKAAASKSKQNPSKSAAQAAELAEKLGVDTLFENPSGEFFTSENLALLSVGQDKTKLTTHKPNITIGASTDAVDTDENEGQGGGEGAGTGEGAGEGSGEQE